MYNKTLKTRKKIKGERIELEAGQYCEYRNECGYTE